MMLPRFIKRFLPYGLVLLTENNPKNQAELERQFRKRRFRCVWASSFAEAKTLLTEKKFLGVVLDHEFRNDPEHRGYELLHYMRRDNEDLHLLPVYVVTSVETADLIEYEYLKIVRYIDTAEHTVSEAVEEMSIYLTPKE